MDITDLKEFLYDYGFTQTNADSLAIIIDSLLNEQDGCMVKSNSDFRLFYQNESNEECETSIFLPDFEGGIGCTLQEECKGQCAKCGEKCGYC